LHLRSIKHCLIDIEPKYFAQKQQLH